MNSNVRSSPARFDRLHPVVGTPGSKDATRVMLLGSGELGKEVIIALQRLGIETIAVDRYDDAPGMQVAHRSHTIPMNDAVALRRVVEAERPDVVVPEIEAIATDALVALEAEGFTVVPTARAANITMNRERIRCLAAETLGLPTSPFRFAGSLDELHAAAEAIGYPCFVKPVMSSSGKGQSKVARAADLEAAWEHAVRGGRVETRRVIVEGAIDFDEEITLLTVRSLGPDGDAVTSFCAPIGHVQIDGDFVESWQPHSLSERALARSQAIARAITADLGGLGLFGVELFIKGDDVWFSEVSPRPHDTGMVTVASQTLSEFDLHVRAFLGLPVEIEMQRAAASAVIYGGMRERGVRFAGLEEALAIPGVDVRLFGKPEAFERRRMGLALARAATVEIARANAKRAAELIRPLAPGTLPPFRA